MLAGDWARLESGKEGVRGMWTFCARGQSASCSEWPMLDGRSSLRWINWACAVVVRWPMGSGKCDWLLAEWVVGELCTDGTGDVMVRRAKSVGRDSCPSSACLLLYRFAVSVQICIGTRWNAIGWQYNLADDAADWSVYHIHAAFVPVSPRTVQPIAAHAPSSFSQTVCTLPFALSAHCSLKRPRLEHDPGRPDARRRQEKCTHRARRCGFHAGRLRPMSQR